MKRCIHCGNENLDVANFCDGCGAALPAVAAAPPLPPPPMPAAPLSPPPPMPAAPQPGSLPMPAALPQTPPPMPAREPFPSEERQPTRGVLRSLATGVEYALEPGKEYMVGRGDPARGLKPEICLEEPAALQQGISRLHAKVLFEAGNFYLVDLNSTNSAYINGNKLVPQQAYSLRSGDMIELGNYKLTFNWV